MTASPTPISPAGGSRQQLVRNLRLFLLLFILLVGALGGWQIWRIRFSTQSFVVQVTAERSVTGSASRALFSAEDLLRFFDYGLIEEGGKEPLVQMSAGAVTKKFPATGAALQGKLGEGQANGFLHYPGADPDRLRFGLGRISAVGDTLRQEVSARQSEDIQAALVDVLFAVRNQHGDTVDRLSDRSGLMEESTKEPGIYSIRLPVSELLFRLHTERSDSLRWNAVAAQDQYALALPLRWFLRASAEQHIVRVDESVPIVPLAPEPKSLEPSSVSLGGDWGGRLQLLGRDLDLVREASLEGEGRELRLEVINRFPELLVLQARKDALTPGRYDLLVRADGERKRLVRALKVEAGFRWVEPAEGQQVPFGSSLDLRWTASGFRGKVLIEALPASALRGRNAQGAWLTVYDGDVSRGQVRWSLEGFAAGDYVLRLRMPDRAEIGELQRPFTILPPPEYQIHFQFTLAGRPYGRIKRVEVDGEPLDLGDDLMLISARLSAGSHELRVLGFGTQPLVKTIEVSEEDEKFRFELQR